MIQVLVLSDPEGFLSVVNASKGAVFLQLPDHSRVNLKENPLAQQMLRLMGPQQTGLTLELTRKEDVPSFLRYLAGAAYL